MLDAAIHTDEGGPVVAADGKILGISTQGARRQTLVIPASTVERTVGVLLEKGTVERGWLGVAGGEGTLVLIVGEQEAARAVGTALKRAGIGVRLWACPLTHAAARSVGLDVDRGRILVDSLSRETELEEVTDAVLMSRSDDFNALAAADLRGDLGHGHVYRFAPDPDEPALLAPTTEVDILGREGLTLAELNRRLADGGQ